MTTTHAIDWGLRRRRAASIFAAALLSLAACGSSDDALPETSAGQTVDTASSGVPEECKVVYPAAFATPDIEDIALLPADWPEPPGGSTLCQTAETVGGSHESADYATDLDAEQVLQAYEKELDPSFDVSRQPGPFGDEVLVGSSGDVDFEISADEGKFRIGLVR